MFFTLLSILFLGLIFVLIESARYQGARAQAANNTDMAHYSAFSEYEQLLLKEFEIFGVDASYGSGDFSIDRFRDRLLSYMNENASPTSAGLALLGFDPWKVRTGSCRISEYALLTDDNAEPFYQQVVTYMKKTAITQAAGTLLSVWDDAQEAKKDQEQFEKEKNTADSKQEELAQKEEEAQKKLEEAQNLQDESGELQPEEAPEGVTPEFKKTMDEYEEFFDEYVEFMQTYQDSDDALGMLTDYTKFMTEYTEAMEALEKIDESDLSDADYAYYLEVMGRINQKLAGAV